MSAKPMDADSLGRIRKRLDAPHRPVSRSDTRSLLAAHDYWRARCPVTAEDVERSGLGADHVSEWFASQMESEHLDGWSPWRRIEDYDGDHMWRHYMHGTYRVRRTPGAIASLIEQLAKDEGRAPHDVLDEMAAKAWEDGE